MENMNRTEADRQLFELGRDLEKAKLESNTAFFQSSTLDGRQFYKTCAEDDWEPLRSPAFPKLAVNTLTAVKDYLTANPDDLETSTTMIHVVSPEIVEVVSAPQGGWLDRQVHVRATALIPTHTFNQFVAPDEFVPYLQSCFCESEDLAALIMIAGNIVDTTEVSSLDDGCSQEVSIRQGAARKAEVPVPSPAVLYPFSTFGEVEQPARKFVFRLSSSPLRCKLLEADGGAWRLAAIISIAQWLRENLPEEVRIIA